ncbi:bifunctional UDP-N-acetylglucosamine diphosphorylase/glucosamine-1-phosphate N-acetyltransferase GlmU [Desulfonatronum sp. SC1]|uniref:bifunctional UDP-N-acetylglucosamine diphosphorylase/glucosamine-1-phosphate N-acetyltransferase GlmU n=1 Tax=Desulfonatronum sp. SC1 TaxID=2109626 RepID=UPI000D31A916|nr:bifunctional UDP-N-acetylglucosamine diphosphorylase/glucosamine-1-phosphate N-acetyltransferase GlmU [Desulfonatronum sp. SC1]PTN32321.1 bifunctional UDP-N-acetylglucosamine diphosphorylase/glucosamine-1-phosphate N-acetyltransferase GlmU [Desulfonatronum sp. SC1]
MQTVQALSVLVLAAGKGTRMHSDKPKVLHTLLGEPMLWYVLEALRPLAAEGTYAIIGHGADLVRKQFPDERFILQKEQLGTGHAVLSAWPEVLAANVQWCLVINGDTPLIDGVMLERFCTAMMHDEVDLAFVSTTLEDPSSYGRVIRDGSGLVRGIVEAKDFDPKRHGEPSGEINAGIYLLRVETLGPLLSKISADNKQGEYYLTDLVDLAVRDGLRVGTFNAGDVGDSLSCMGVNSPLELADSEDVLRRRAVQALQRGGVTIHLPDTVSIGPRVLVEPGAEIFGPCELYGAVHICRGAVLESHTWIKNARIGSGSVVRSFSHLEGATVGEGCIVGPYARLRPDAVLETGARIGNFVEMKKARLGKNAKASHLTYLGDAEVGEDVNIGAGTITCNYDGKRKHLTEIGPRAFIGSNTALVAPVRIGADALVGAGSVITKDVPDASLAVARGKQRCFARRKSEEPGV